MNVFPLMSKRQSSGTQQCPAAHTHTFLHYEGQDLSVETMDIFPRRPWEQMALQCRCTRSSGGEHVGMFLKSICAL